MGRLISNERINRAPAGSDQRNNAAFGGGRRKRAFFPAGNGPARS